MGSAVETLCGQAFGAGEYPMLGIYLQRSTILLVLTGIPLTFIYIFSKPLLILIGQSKQIAGAASIFIMGLIPQIFAYACNFPIQKFLQAQSIVNPSPYIDKYGGDVVSRDVVLSDIGFDCQFASLSRNSVAFVGHVSNYTELGFDDFNRV